jgi:toxin ParE1/3/4
MNTAAPLLFSAFVRQDLLEITRYIAKENPQRAHDFVSALRAQCALLATQPKLGVARPELAQSLRSIPYQRYIIFFSPTASGVLIERVLHGARDLPSLLQRE